MERRGGHRSSVCQQMNKAYWSNFYLSFDESSPSSFAVFCRPYLTGLKVVDWCCGNGRDTYFLAEACEIVGIDFAVKPEDRGNARFVRCDVKDYMRQMPAPDVVYCRFALHAVSKEEEEALLSWGANHLFIETRINSTEGYYGNHTRRYIDERELKQRAMGSGYEIVYDEVSHEFSPYRGNKPELLRLMLKQ